MPLLQTVNFEICNCSDHNRSRERGASQAFRFRSWQFLHVTKSVPAYKALNHCEGLGYRHASHTAGRSKNLDRDSRLINHEIVYHRKTSIWRLQETVIRRL